MNRKIDRLMSLLVVICMALSYTWSVQAASANLALNAVTYGDGKNPNYAVDGKNSRWQTDGNGSSILRIKLGDNPVSFNKLAVRFYNPQGIESYTVSTVEEYADESDLTQTGSGMSQVCSIADLPLTELDASGYVTKLFEKALASRYLEVSVAPASGKTVGIYELELYNEVPEQIIADTSEPLIVSGGVEYKNTLAVFPADASGNIMDYIFSYSWSAPDAQEYVSISGNEISISENYTKAELTLHCVATDAEGLSIEADFTYSLSRMSEEELDMRVSVEQAYEEFGIENMLNSQQADNVMSTLNFPAGHENGALYSWSTSDESVISASGKVTRQNENRNITVTLTISKGSYEMTKNFLVTVAAKGVYTNAVNLALNKKVWTVNSGWGNGRGAVDGNESTQWASGGHSAGSSANLVMWLGNEPVKFNKVIYIPWSSSHSSGYQITAYDSFSGEVPDSDYGTIAVGTGGDVILSSATHPYDGDNKISAVLDEVMSKSYIYCNVMLGEPTYANSTGISELQLLYVEPKYTELSENFEMFKPNSGAQTFSFADAIIVCDEAGESMGSNYTVSCSAAQNYSGVTIDNSNKTITVDSSFAGESVDLVFTTTLKGFSAISGTFTVDVPRISQDFDDVYSAYKNLKVNGSDGEEIWVADNLTLPFEDNGVKITWTSSDPNVVSETGALNRNFDAEGKNITLTATLSKGEFSREKTFKLYVLRNMTDKELAQMLLQHIELAESTELSKNLDLPKESLMGYAVEWSSDDESRLTSSGKVNVNASGRKKVTLTARISVNGASASREWVYYIGKDSGGGASSGSSGSSPVFSSQTTPPPANNNQTDTSVPTGIFADLPDSHWASAYVRNLADKGIISGVGENNFAPDNYITREEFVKILVSALGIPAADKLNDSFSDADENAWYYPYVAAAYNAGILSGCGDGTLGVGRNITREDMSVLVVKALESSGRSLESDFELNFTDNEQISDYAKESIRLLKGMGIVSGDENNLFCPKEPLTRAQAATVVYMSLNENSQQQNQTAGFKYSDKLMCLKNMDIVNIPDSALGSTLTREKLAEYLIAIADSSNAAGYDVTFDDQEQISSNAPGNAVSLGLMSAYANSFRPKAAATYADVYQGFSVLLGIPMANLTYTQAAIKNKFYVAEEDAVVTNEGFLSVAKKALECEVYEIKNFTGGNVSYKKGGNILEVYLDIYSGKGQVLGYGKSVISAAGEEMADGEVLIDGAVYLTGKVDMQPLLGHYVNYYYYAPENDDDYVLCYAQTNSATKITVIDADDISDSSTKYVLKYRKDGVGGEKTKNFPLGTKFLYNGKLLPEADMTDDLFDIETGTVTIIEVEGGIDVVIIECYLYAEVKEIRNDGVLVRVYDDDGNPGERLIIAEEEPEDYTLEVYKAGETASFLNINVGDFIAFADATDRYGERSVTIHILSDFIRGKYTGVDDEYITIDGKEYNAVENLKYILSEKHVAIGDDVAVYYDLKKQHIVGVVNVLIEEPVYGLFIRGYYENEGDSKVLFHILTQAGEHKQFAIAERPTLNGKRIYIADELEKRQNGALGQLYDAEGAAVPQVIIYYENQDGEIYKMFTVTPKNDTSDPLNVISLQKAYYKGHGVFAWQYMMKGDCPIFWIEPENDISSEKKYVIATKSAIPNDGTPNVDLYNVDESNRAAAVVIHDYKRPYDGYAQLAVVDKVWQGENKEGDITYFVSFYYKSGYYTYGISLNTAKTDAMLDMAKGMKRGDTIQYILTTDNSEIFEMTYDLQINNLKPTGIGVGTKRAVEYGRVKSHPTPDIILMEVFTNSNSDYAIYPDVSRNNIYLYNGEKEPIKLLNSSQIKTGDYIVLLAQYAQAKDILVIRDETKTDK